MKKQVERFYSSSASLLKYDSVSSLSSSVIGVGDVLSTVSVLTGTTLVTGGIVTFSAVPVLLVPNKTLSSSLLAHHMI